MSSIGDIDYRVSIGGLAEVFSILSPDFRVFHFRPGLPCLPLEALISMPSIGGPDLRVFRWRP